MPDGSPPPHPDPALPHDVGCLGLDRTRPRRAANDAIDPMLHFENCCPTRVGVQTTAEGWQRRHRLITNHISGQICPPTGVIWRMSDTMSQAVESLLAFRPAISSGWSVERIDRVCSEISMT